MIFKVRHVLLKVVCFTNCSMNIVVRERERKSHFKVTKTKIRCSKPTKAAAKIVVVAATFNKTYVGFAQKWPIFFASFALSAIFRSFIDEQKKYHCRSYYRLSKNSKWINMLEMHLPIPKSLVKEDDKKIEAYFFISFGIVIHLFLCMCVMSFHEKI